eukprot:317098-Rhodomonas_salina.3
MPQVGQFLLGVSPGLKPVLAEELSDLSFIMAARCAVCRSARAHLRHRTPKEKKGNWVHLGELPGV